jgi:hypothetical protein
MKLLYEFALALQILLAKQMKIDIIRTGRRPKQVWTGTLLSLMKFHVQEFEAYQMKLLNPSTKIATPVNCTTSVKFESNATI